MDLIVDNVRALAAAFGYKLVPVSKPAPNFTDKLASLKLASLITRAAFKTDGMSEKEVHAHYARIAPFEDVRTFLKRTDLSDTLRERATALLDRIVTQDGKHTTATKAEYRALHQAWRAERNQADPAFGGFTPSRAIALPEVA